MIFDDMRNFPKNDDVPDRKKQGDALRLVLDNFVGAETLRIWKEVALWLATNHATIDKEEPLNYLFTYYRQNKKLPNEVWVNELLSAVSDSERTLMSIFDAQAKVLMGKNADGSSTPSGYRDF